MRRWLFIAALLALAGPTLAAPSFPKLSGRVVDAAQVLSAPARAMLDTTLANQEAQTTNQVVVVTVKSLRGLPIEEYGYRLGRAWGIGQKGKNNGLLFIIAPNERKVRIEVGYGLEGVMTDALASQIIQSVVLPSFKAGEMERGIVRGTNTIVNVLNGDMRADTQSDAPNAEERQAQAALIAKGILGFFILCAVGMVYAFIRQRRKTTRKTRSFFSGWKSVGASGGSSFTSSADDDRSDSSSSSSSNSGGGGSFGGGGSSGSW